MPGMAVEGGFPNFPMVVYHGEAEWRIPLDFIGGVDLCAHDALRPHHLDFRYSLADLGRIDDAAVVGQSSEGLLRLFPAHKAVVP